MRGNSRSALIYKSTLSKRQLTQPTLYNRLCNGAKWTFEHAR